MSARALRDAVGALRLAGITNVDGEVAAVRELLRQNWPAVEAVARHLHKPGEFGPTVVDGATINAAIECSTRRPLVRRRLVMRPRTVRPPAGA